MLVGYPLGLAYAYFVKLPGWWKLLHLLLFPLAALAVFVGWALAIEYLFPPEYLPVPSGGFAARDFAIGTVLGKLGVGLFGMFGRRKKAAASE